MPAPGIAAHWLAACSFDAKCKRIQAESPHGRRPAWAVRPIIVKSGDDCRQELLAVQLISTFHDIFQVYLPLAPSTKAQDLTNAFGRLSEVWCSKPHLSRPSECIICLEDVVIYLRASHSGCLPGKEHQGYYILLQCLHMHACTDAIAVHRI